MFNFVNNTIIPEEGLEIVSYNPDGDFILKDENGNLYVCYICVKDTSPTLSAVFCSRG